MTISANFPSIRPSLLLDFANEQALDPRITFTRSTTGTYYNGYSSAVAEQNLLTYSQDFTNAIWGKNGATVTGNSTTAPDGTTTAGLIVEDTTTTYHGIYETYTAILATPFTFSVYLKKQTRQYAFVGFNFSASFGSVLQIDLNAGTIAYSNTAGAGYSITASSITSVGSGWYRVVLTGTTGQTALSVSFGSAGATLWTAGVIQGNTFLGDGTSGVYAWGAQLEQRSSVTAYTATTTTAITNYIPILQTGAINQARFDHNPTTGESLGLLIEQQSSNLLTYSSDYTNAVWTKGGASVTTSANIAPDGTQTATQLVEDTSTGVHRAYEAVTLVSGTTYSFTVYAKANTRSQFAIVSSDGVTSRGTGFDLSAGTTFSVGLTSPTSASMTLVGNGWYRCVITYTSGGTAGNFQIDLCSAQTTSYTGNGYSGVYIWGAQLEALAFSTSYIPTVASQVTRSADSASMIGTNFSSWYNISQGTLYAQATMTAIGTGTGAVDIVDIVNASGTGLEIYRNTNTAGVSGYIGTGTTGAGNITANAQYKYALSYSPTTGSILINGSSPVSITPASYAPTVGSATTLGIMKNAPSGISQTGWVTKIAYYPIAVSSANLIALTGS